ncbi:DUF502 domain-containing protein [Zeimonas arvi]|uniref:DUF502 domain-containing protein n=1 Tax=Zeimonas arvi TaxID=2498847 RepID=A0A5C8NTU3_9BURK|nr:DUF502 domain-containing protein [Zeimonas arvi]TXL64314.1 DUF502 domain-containing protein [Zeimonas arvi]
MRRLFNIFVTGALAALPLAATIAIFVWAARLAAEYLGPYSLVGRTLSSIGLGVGGSEVAAYAIGVLIVLVAIFLLGMLVRTRLRGVMTWAVDSVMRRIPVVRSVYDTVKKFVDLLAQREEPATRSMRPVWLHFGGVGGAAVLGLLSTPEPVRIGEIDYLAVLVPTSPVPVGGGLIYVPSGWVMPAEVGVEGLTSIYVSMGITSAQHLGEAKRR